MNNSDLFDFANMSNSAYSGGHYDGRGVGNYSLVTQSDNLLSGFAGTAFYNHSTNTLAVGFAGTNDHDDVEEDMLGVVLTGGTVQIFDAVNLTRSALKDLASHGVKNPDIVLTGHSLGGFLAQQAADYFPGRVWLLSMHPAWEVFWAQLYRHQAPNIPMYIPSIRVQPA